MFASPYNKGMTNYTDAPACKILATHCCVCARPLLDSVSVDLGIGPDCRKKYMGKNGGHSEEARIEANKIVYQLALVVSGMKPDAIDGIDTAAVQAAMALGGTQAVGAMLAASHAEGATLLDRLRTLGFDKLADKFEKNWMPIRITKDGSNLLVEAPFNDAALLTWRGIKGQTWDKVRKCRVVPVGSATLNGPDTNNGKVWALLQKHYPGVAGIGPKGPFVVPSKATPANGVMMNTKLSMAEINAQEDAREARKEAYLGTADMDEEIRAEYYAACDRGEVVA